MTEGLSEVGDGLKIKLQVLFKYDSLYNFTD